MQEHAFLGFDEASDLVSMMCHIANLDPQTVEHEQALYGLLAAFNMLLTSDGWVARWIDSERTYKLYRMEIRPPRL